MAGLEAERTAVLIDRHPLWLDILERSLNQVGIRTIAKLASPAEGLRLLEEQGADLLVIDPDTGQRAGEIDALTCIRRAREQVARLKAVVFTSSESPQRIAEAFAAGALAYVVKTVQGDDFVAAIRQVFQQSLHFAVRHAATPDADAPPPGRLTRREVEILRLVSDGRTNTEVARILFVTEQTVKFHLSNIYRKLSVSNRTEAARWAQVHGLLAGPASAAS
jgi:DNA-binding NarL/FixJ family response regulator